MTSHFSILPSDIIQYLSLSIGGQTNKGTERPLRILRLPHPRTGLPASFLPLEWLPSSALSEVSPLSTLLEIQSISPPEERSWILGEHVESNGKLLIMTPIDPTFLLFHILRTAQPIDLSDTRFRTADDLFEESAKVITSHISTADSSSCINVQDILDFCSLSCTRKSLTHLCDLKEVSSDITVFRLSLEKFIEHIRTKVNHLEKSSAIDNSRIVVRSLAKDGLMEDGNEELLQLGRIRACCDLISQYLAPEVRDLLLSSYDFTKLQKHLESNMRDSVVTSTASSKSRGAQGSKAPAATDKKRKAVKASRGIENLKKANTTGMAKLSSFFGKT